MPPLSRRGLLAGSAALASVPARAQEAPYPNRPVRLVVPFVPGGSVDILNRAFAQALGRELGQPVVVENRPGGTTTIGTAFVARSAADGYTLLAGGDNVELNRYLMAQLPYDPDRDLLPVMQLADVPYLLIVHPSVPARSLRALIALAKAEPGRLTYASFGIGGGGHLSGELLCHMAGIEALHVPYPGNPPALIDVAAGRVSMMFCTIPVAQGELQSGRVIPIAISSAKRVRALPEVPTLSEAGLAGYESTGQMILYAPRAVPEAVLRRLAEATPAAMAAPELVALLERQGFVLTPPQDLEATRTQIKAKAARMAEVIRAAGIRL